MHRPHHDFSLGLLETLQKMWNKQTKESKNLMTPEAATAFFDQSGDNWQLLVASIKTKARKAIESMETRRDKKLRALGEVSDEE